MANKIYINPETAITWQDTAGTYAMTLNNLAAGTGWQGAIHNFGAAARAFRFAWRAWVQFATAPVVGEAVQIYLKTSDGTYPDNDDGTGNIAVSAQDKLRNLHFIGAIVVDEALQNIVMVKSGIAELYARYVMPVFWNATADNLRAANDTSGFKLTPVPFEIQP